VTEALVNMKDVEYEFTDADSEDQLLYFMILMYDRTSEITYLHSAHTRLGLFTDNRKRWKYCLLDLYMHLSCVLSEPFTKQFTAGHIVFGMENI
jgi:hypothetical protein